MRKLLCVLTILLLLPACGGKQQNAQSTEDTQNVITDAAQSVKDAQDKTAQTYKQALFLRAVSDENIDKVRELLSADVDVNIVTEDGYTAVHLAIMRHYPELVKFLVANGANLETKNRLGETPLHLASIGHLEIVKLFVNERVDLNAKNEEGETSLHVAAQVADAAGLPVARVLIMNGADLNIMDNNGRTPLDVALKSKNPDTANLLARHGAVSGKETGETGEE